MCYKQKAVFLQKGHVRHDANVPVNDMMASFPHNIACNYRDEAHSLDIDHHPYLYIARKWMEDDANV